MFDRKLGPMNNQSEIILPSLETFGDCLSFAFLVSGTNNKQFLSCYKKALKSQLKIVERELKSTN